MAVFCCSRLLLVAHGLVVAGNRNLALHRCWHRARLPGESPQKDVPSAGGFLFWEQVSDDDGNAELGTVVLAGARFRFARVGGQFRFCARL